jgi:hypothetical protein
MSGAGEYDIFISYTHEDSATAKRLAEELSSRGWSVFWDRVLLPGATWRTQIQSALTSARVVLVMWSEKAVNSRWVEIEADHAFQREAYVPVTIDSAPLPLGLSHVQVADLRPWHADAAHSIPDVLISALSHRLGAGSATTLQLPTPVPLFRPPPAPPPMAHTMVSSDATMVAADVSLHLAGADRDGAKFEIIVRLSQLRMKPAGLVIGRKADQADLILPHVSVSRRHALLASADQRLTLSDLGSTNGTFVNNRPALADHPLELAKGAVVRLGDVELTVGEITR